MKRVLTSEIHVDAEVNIVKSLQNFSQDSERSNLA